MARGSSPGTGDRHQRTGGLIFLPLGVMLLWPGIIEDGERVLAAGPAGARGAIAVYLVATGMPIDPQRHFHHVYALLFQPNSLNTMGFYRPGIRRPGRGRLGCTRNFSRGCSGRLRSRWSLLAVAGAWRPADRAAPVDSTGPARDAFRGAGAAGADSRATLLSTDGDHPVRICGVWHFSGGAGQFRRTAVR